MTRASTTPSTILRATLPLVALSLAACSFSFKAGSGSTEAGKPAQGAPAAEDAGTPASKPIADADTSDPAKPADGGTDAAATEPADDGPSRVPPETNEPPPSVEPQATAVCRVADETLADICHRVLDPVAANDIVAWQKQLTDETTLIRPSHTEGKQRLRGPKDIGVLAAELGSLRTLLHYNDADRVVGTLHHDCRRCRRSIVAFEANSRSGTIVVTVDMTKPPKVSLVEVASRVGRPHLGEARRPGKADMVHKPGRRPVEEPKSEEPKAEEPKAEVKPKATVQPKTKTTLQAR